MTAPRRTKALVAAERALFRARERLASGEAGWDPWRVAAAQARYDAALNQALGDGPAPLTSDEGDVPRMLVGRFGR